MHKQDGIGDDSTGWIRVSVVIPVHNGGTLLQRAIDSVLAQTEQNLEIIIVDDGSTDNTWDVVIGAMAADQRVRGLRNRTNLRAPAASNLGIEAARGLWIAILDHDDWYHPDRLKTLLESGEQANVDLVTDNQYFFDAQARAVFRTAFSPGLGQRALSLSTLLKNAQTGVPIFDYGMLKPVIRTKFLHSSGIRYLVDCHEGQDFHFLLDSFVNGCTALLHERPYYFYTVPFGPVSRRSSYANKKFYDYPRMRAFTEQAIVQYGHLLSDGDRRLLKKRSDSISAYSRYMATKDALHNGQSFVALRGLFDPRVWPFILRAAMRHIMRRMPSPSKQTSTGHYSAEDIFVIQPRQNESGKS